jgi:hypothetical protein
MKIITFFSSSHYWGGQLKNEAEKAKINRGLKKNGETRWYALILMALSVKSHRYVSCGCQHDSIDDKICTVSLPLTQICIRDDAQRKIGGLSPVSRDVVDTVLHDRNFWPRIDQLIKTTKPIVDAIGNLECREASLADCMLELIRCARVMGRLQIDDGDDLGFHMHAKACRDIRASP